MSDVGHLSFEELLWALTSIHGQLKLSVDLVQLAPKLIEYLLNRKSVILFDLKCVEPHLLYLIDDGCALGHGDQIPIRHNSVILGFESPATLCDSVPVDLTHDHWLTAGNMCYDSVKRLFSPSVVYSANAKLKPALVEVGKLVQMIWDWHFSKFLGHRSSHDALAQTRVLWGRLTLQLGSLCDVSMFLR